MVFQGLFRDFDIEFLDMVCKDVSYLLKQVENFLGNDLESFLNELD